VLGTLADRVRAFHVVRKRVLRPLARHRRKSRRHAGRVAPPPARSRRARRSLRRRYT
jgi:hypothetical protein